MKTLLRKFSFALPLLLLLGFPVPLVQAECPAIETIPVLFDSLIGKDDTFLCAIYWTVAGDDDEVQACSHCEEYTPNGIDVPDGNNEYGKCFCSVLKFQNNVIDKYIV